MFWRILPAELIPSHLLLLTFNFISFIPLLPVALCPFHLFVAVVIFVVIIICFSSANFLLILFYFPLRHFSLLDFLSFWFSSTFSSRFSIFVLLIIPYVLYHHRPFLFSCFRLLRMRLTLAECRVIPKSKLLIALTNHTWEANTTGKWINIFTCNAFPLRQTPLTSQGIFNASVILKWHLQ